MLRGSLEVVNGGRCHEVTPGPEPGRPALVLFGLALVVRVYDGIDLVSEKGYSKQSLHDPPRRS